jgi:predicted PurR-regulated permease PerM
LSLKDIQSWSLSTGTMFRFIALLIGLMLLYVVRDIVASLLFAVIIASAFEPAIQWLRNRKIPRIVGAILIYFVIAFALFFIIYLVFPLIFEELNNISVTFPQIQEEVLTRLERFELLPFSSLLTENISELIRLPTEYMLNVSGGIVSFASTVFGGVFSFILIVIFSFYLLTQERGIETFLRLVAPLAYEPYIVDVWSRSQRTLGRWLRAQLLLGALVGVLIFFSLTFLGIEHAFLLALLAAIFELIPIVGPILAAVPAVAIAFFTSPLLGFGTIGLYVLVQQFESNVIVPVVMRKAIGLSPLIVVLALLVGARVGGLFGLLLAVPITAIVVELIGDWDKKKRELLPE